MRAHASSTCSSSSSLSGSEAASTQNKPRNHNRGDEETEKIREGVTDAHTP